MNIPQLWRSFYPDESPIAYLLREQIPERWFRIHCLPESKRYAEDEGETREILRRYNAVASEVLSEKELCAFFSPHYAVEVLPAAFAEVKRQFFMRHRTPDSRITMFAAEVQWQSCKFDAILRSVADDKVGYISWMNPKTSEIFAPYDGGADLFLDSTERRDTLKTKYKAWLSAHSEGL